MGMTGPPDCRLLTPYSQEGGSIVAPKGTRFKVGDHVEFTGAASSHEIPQMRVHRGYDVKGHRGVVVGFYGSQPIVRLGSTGRSTAPPGEGYDDYWASAAKLKRVDE